MPTTNGTERFLEISMAPTTIFQYHSWQISGSDIFSFLFYFSLDVRQRNVWSKFYGIGKESCRAVTEEWTIKGMDTSQWEFWPLAKGFLSQTDKIATSQRDTRLRNLGHGQSVILVNSNENHMRIEGLHRGSVSIVLNMYDKNEGCVVKAWVVMIENEGVDYSIDPTKG
jgi:hypothetical protein